MAKPLLSAALIVKNEATNLPRCIEALNALYPLVSEVCVYDTGSTDGTPDLARSLGARVEEGYWDDDFARARNASLAMCNSVWALCVDADEVIHANAPSLRKYLRGLAHNVVAATVEIRSVNAVGEVGKVSRMTRLARLGEARFINALHERLEPVRPGGADPVQAPASGVWVEHFGYADDSTVVLKLERNEKVISGQIDRARSSHVDADRLSFLLLNRAITLFGKREVELAEVDLAEVRQVNPDICTLYWAYALELHATAMIDRGDAAKAQIIIDELRELGASDSYSDWLQAKVMIQTDQPMLALDILRSIAFMSFSTGILVDGLELPRTRMEAALAAGEYQEAIACALTLIVNHDVIKEPLTVILQLCEEKDLEGVAGIISSAKPIIFLRIAEISEELGGKGTVLANAIKSKTLQIT